MVRKNHAPECAVTLWGPDITMQQANGAWVDVELNGNEHGTNKPIIIIRIFFEDNSEEVNLRLTSDEHSRRICHSLEEWEAWWQIGVLCNRGM